MSCQKKLPLQQVLHGGINIQFELYMQFMNSERNEDVIPDTKQNHAII
jgi:hypothetical protein